MQRPVTIDGAAYLLTRDGYDALLYRTNGVKAVLLHRFVGANDSPPGLFTSFAGTTWFAATDLAHGRELWRTDGTPEGTRLARDIAPGRMWSDPLDLVATDDFLFLTAFDPVNGPEPWRIPPRATAGRRARPAWHGPRPAGHGRAVAADAGRAAPPAPPAPPAPATRPPVATSKASLSIRAKRLRTLRGWTRWRVSGTASACPARVRIVLGRGQRSLKTTRARVARCRTTPSSARRCARAGSRSARSMSRRAVSASDDPDETFDCVCARSPRSWRGPADPRGLALRVGRRRVARTTLADMMVLRFGFLAVLIAGTIGALKAQPRTEAEAATLEITAADRARGLTFAPGVAAADREWILAAIAKARPEAARLIDEATGSSSSTTFSAPGACFSAWSRPAEKRYELRLNVRA